VGTDGWVVFLRSRLFSPLRCLLIQMSLLENMFGGLDRHALFNEGKEYAPRRSPPRTVCHHHASSRLYFVRLSQEFKSLLNSQLLYGSVDLGFWFFFRLAELVGDELRRLDTLGMEGSLRRLALGPLLIVMLVVRGSWHLLVSCIHVRPPPCESLYSGEAIVEATHAAVN
jgi:hypothetical protein